MRPAPVFRQILRGFSPQAVGRYTHDDAGYRWTAIRCSSVMQWKYRDFGQGPVILPFRWFTLQRSEMPLP